MRLVVDYERRLREDLNSKQALEENLRKLSMEVCLHLCIHQIIIMMQNPDMISPTLQVSTLKNEKEILQKSEKRASDEVRDLTERVHRLQVYFSHCDIYVFLWIRCHFTFMRCHCFCQIHPLFCFSCVHACVVKILLYLSSHPSLISCRQIYKVFPNI